MAIDKKFLNLFTKATEKAAIGASKFIGKKDKIAADKGAVDPMRRELNKINMQGTVVIGEGEMDEAPMLYIGERLGTLNGPEFDIAVDPLEGTKFTANGQPNAFSVLAISEKNCLLSAPDTYMEKIVIGTNLPKNLMDIDNGVEKNIKILAEAKNKKISDIQACVLKRPRHDHIVKVLNDLKVKINFITDGDIAGALSVIGDKPKNDIYYSTGGGPEGVIVAVKPVSCILVEPVEVSLASTALITCNTLPKLPLILEPAIAALLFISALTIVPSCTLSIPVAPLIVVPIFYSLWFRVCVFYSFD